MQEVEKKQPDFYTDYQSLMDDIETITKNRQGFSYSYADLNAVYDEIKPKVKNHNFMVLQTVKKGSGDVRRSCSAVPLSKDKAGNITMTSAIDWEIPVYELHTELVHKPTGKVISCDLPLVMDDVDPQALGSAITYMRRYSFYVVLGITTEDDDGLSASAKGKFNQDFAQVMEPLPDKYDDMGTFLMKQEDPKKYYRAVKNHPSLSEEQKKKLFKIMYPK